MTDPLSMPDLLTTDQRVVVDAPGNIFLTACPGSGKTRTAGVRLARLGDDGFRVAACSYTNTGVEQIRRVLTTDLRRPVGPQHFVGTLHMFLLTYVVHPFGHLRTHSDKAHRIIVDERFWPQMKVSTNRKRSWEPLSAFCFDKDGGLVFRPPSRSRTDPVEAVKVGGSDALRKKKELARAGILSADDAMYIALRVLKTNRDVAAAVAARFDELLVDEAQDTSELQLACLETLYDTGKLRSLVLIGDLEQSICSFNGADRQGCADLAAHCKLNELTLRENQRSSQLICNTAAHFCDRTAPDIAVGPDKAVEIAPELMFYERGHPRVAVARFRQRLDELGIDPAGCAVLARGGVLVDRLNGGTSAVKIAAGPEALGRAVATLRTRRTPRRRQIDRIDRLLTDVAWGRGHHVSDSTLRWRVREATMQLLERAPELSLDLKSWIEGVREPFREAVATLDVDPPATVGKLLPSSPSHEAYLAKDVFTLDDALLRARTIHDVKGESVDAALVVAGSGGGHRRADADLWSTRLAGQQPELEEAEELRILFVALTRARRYVALALLASTSDDLVARYKAAGFHVI